MLLITDFFLNFQTILKFVKICEFYKFLKFITVRLSYYVPSHQSVGFSSTCNTEIYIVNSNTHLIQVLYELTSSLQASF